MAVGKENKNQTDVQNSLLEKHDVGQGQDGGDATEDDNEGVPTDTGWAWVIVLSLFIIMTVIIGFLRSMSVLFVDIKDEFQERATVVSLMFTLHALFTSVATIIVSNIIMSRFSERMICAVSSIGNCLCSVFISVAPNIVVFLLLFVLKGLFFGALLVVPMSMIGFYFKKRRSLASSIGTAGMCVAFITFPPITELLREQFGMRGSLLVIAAIELHLLAFSLLLRPAKSYKTLYKSYKRKNKYEEERLRQQSPIYTGPKDGAKKVSTELLPPQFDYSTGRKPDRNGRLMSDWHTGSTDLETDEHLYRLRSYSDASHRQEVDTPIDVGPIPHSLPTTFSILKEEEFSLGGSGEDVEYVKPARKRRIILERQASHLSAISVTELPYIAPEIVKEEYEEDGSKKPKQTLFSFLLSIFIDKSLFQIWRFRMMTIFVPLSVFANYTIVYMPVICVTLNIDKRDAALMMTISGCMDLITRIATGFVGDFEWLSLPKLVAFSTFAMGTVCHFTRFFTSHTLFLVYAILVGVFGGIRQNFLSVMLLKYVGTEKMAKAYGLSSTLATLSMSINHPVVAAMFDATGGFVIPLHYVGAVVYLGTIILFFEPFFKKLDEKNFAKNNQKVTANES